MRYLIAAPDGQLADWQIRCVGHLTKAGARAVAMLVAAQKVRAPRSIFWTLACATPRPHSTRRLHAGRAFPDLPLVRSVDALGDALGDEPIDFVLDFGAHPLVNAVPASVFDALRLGWWRFAFPPTPRGAPPGAGDIAAGRDVAAAALVSCDVDGVARHVLKRGALAIVRTSLAEHVDSLLYEAARWPANACETAASLASAAEPVADERSLFTDVERARDAGDAAGYIARSIVSSWSEFWRRLLFSSSWNLGVARVPIESFAIERDLPVIEWFPKREIPRFAADPFGIEVGGRRVVLCESMFPGADGTIHSTVFDAKTGAWEPLRPSLELPFHLSYPYVFEHGGAVYCVPEASGSGEIALYRAVNFPDSWEKCATLIAEFGGVDSTLVEHDGRWWMFCGDIDDGADYKLYIFYADDVIGPWRAHAANPVKIDVRSARGAGTPFIVAGVLYRPAQDCSQTYGGRVVVNRVKALTPTEFVEERASVIDPDPRSPFRFGLHTLSRFGDYTLIDGKQRYLSMSRVARVVRRPLVWLRRMFASGSAVTDEKPLPD